MDNLKRCRWLDNTKEDYVKYHDDEWGVPVYDDRVFFEFLVLESAQAGLSWYTILKRRENYRKAFAGFDPAIVATFDDDKVEELMLDAGIIRYRAKIKSAINNAQCFLTIQQEFGSFSDYVWGFVGNKQIVNDVAEGDMPPATTKESDALAKDLKKRGFKFLGSTTIYAFMQGCGLVDDHNHDCFRK